jgi:RNase H-fold protein (predicted Holliday junction resolvase)
MKKKFEGSARVKRSTLQALRRDFEALEMKVSETITEYFARVLSIANKMRSNGEQMKDTIIVEKILRTLIEKFNYVVVSIEESKDIDTLTIDELQSSLTVHEQKFSRSHGEEQAFKVTVGDRYGSRGRGRGDYRGRGRGRGRQALNKATVECYKCHQLGHF